ncbi:MAG: hypothetical protein LC108_04865, partial [Anaerolineales bacterium]|nr:hypothetical protein [Anaerolineales bacterium]
MRTIVTRFAFLALALMLVISACSPAAPAATEPPAVSTAPAEPYVFGLLMVGPYNDHGYSQAHYEAGKYVEEKIGAKMVYIDKVNTADRPGT